MIQSSPGEPQKTIKSDWPWFLALFFAVVITRLTDFLGPFYSFDEITTVLYAELILNGQVQLSDFIGHNSYLFHAYYWLHAKLFGSYQLTSIYLANLFFVFLAAVVFFKIIEFVVNDKKKSFFASLLFLTATLCFIARETRAMIPETLSYLPLLLLFFVALCYHCKPSYLLAFVMGLILGVVFLIKVTFAIVGLALCFFFVVQTKKTFFKHLIFALFGFFVTFLLPALGTESFGVFFEKWQSQFQQNYEHYVVPGATSPLGHTFFRFVSRSFLLLISMPLVVFGLYYLFYSKKKQKQKFQQKIKPVVRLGLLFVVSLLCIVPLGRRIFYHYFMPMIPFLVLLASFGLIGWWNLIQDHKKKLLKPIIVFFFLLTPIGFTFDTYFKWSVYDYSYQKLPGWIQKNTKPQDTIFVWGKAFDLYYFAKRIPATRFFWAEQLAGYLPGSNSMIEQQLGKAKPDTSAYESLLQDFELPEWQPSQTFAVTPSPLVPLRGTGLLTLDEMTLGLLGAWQQVIDDFKKQWPQLIIDTSPSGWGWFGHFPIAHNRIMLRILSERYEYIGRIDKFDIYQLKK